MRLPGMGRRDLALDYGKGVATLDDSKRALAKALKATPRQVERSADQATPVCLVGQTRSGADYAAQRRHWLRRARGWSAEQWPERLPQGQYAIFLAPLSPDSVTKPRQHPKPIAVPCYIDFDLSLAPEAALAIVVGVWLEQIGARDFRALALTPPILERYAAGRLIARGVLDYGLDWTLPPPLPAV